MDAGSSISRDAPGRQPHERPEYQKLLAAARALRAAGRSRPGHASRTVARWLINPPQCGLNLRIGRQAGWRSKQLPLIRATPQRILQRPNPPTTMTTTAAPGDV